MKQLLIGKDGNSTAMKSKLQYHQLCHACNRHGKILLRKTGTCSVCLGLGKKKHGKVSTVCWNCSGSGIFKIEDTTCAECGGKGWLTSYVEIVDFSIELCLKCDGSGRVKRWVCYCGFVKPHFIRKMTKPVCPHCNGTIEATFDTCSICKGTGGEVIQRLRDVETGKMHRITQSICRIEARSPAARVTSMEKFIDKLEKKASSRVLTQNP